MKFSKLVYLSIISSNVLHLKGWKRPAHPTKLNFKCCWWWSVPLCTLPSSPGLWLHRKGTSFLRWATSGQTKRRSTLLQHCCHMGGSASESCHDELKSCFIVVKGKGLRFSLIPDLLFLVVTWERRLSGIKAVTSLWTNHIVLFQWKKKHCLGMWCPQSHHRPTTLLVLLT